MEKKNVGTFEIGLHAYLGKSLRRMHVIENNRSREMFEKNAVGSMKESQPRWVYVDPAIYPGITTDQNANPWVDGAEYELVDEGNGLPKNTPAVLLALWEAVVEAAEGQKI